MHGTPCTIQKAIWEKKFQEGIIWIKLTQQLLEALCYLHEKACIIHNDIKADNVLLTNSFADDSSIQVVLIDFGKATNVNEGRKLELCKIQKEEYMQKCPHIAPEVIEGVMCESTFSDIYGIGGIFLSIYDRNCLLPSYKDRPDVCDAYLSMSTKCRSVKVQQRPSARQALEMLIL